MASKNRVELVGNLGGNPEIRYTKNGKSVCNFTVATNEEWKDENGTKHKNTDWHRVTIWGKAAENATKLLSKGTLVMIEGKLKNRTWEKDGVKHYTTEVVALSFQKLSPRRDQPVETGDNAPQMGEQPPADETLPL